MANHYCKTSTEMEVPVEKIEQAKDIYKRVMNKLLDEGVDLGVDVQFLPKQQALWFYGTDVNLHEFEKFAKELIEELDLPYVDNNPFLVSYSYGTEGREVDGFGGGAIAIRKGRRTVWHDALVGVRSHLNDLD